MKNNKSNLWAVVLYRTGMRIYNYVPSHEQRGVSLVQELENPEGHLKDRDLSSDRPGRVFNRLGNGHSLETHQSPSQHVLEVFTKKISSILEQARSNGLFSSFILIAGPSFLGVLRKKLRPKTLDHLVYSLNKDFVNLNHNEMKLYLEKNIKKFLAKVQHVH